MKISAVLLCSLGLFVNVCKSDNYRDRDRDRDNRDRNRGSEYDRERERDNREREREDPQSLYCRDLNPQNQLDMEHITGMWYGSEVITHHDNLEGESLQYVCIIIHLAEITQQMTTIRPRRISGGDDYYNNRQTGYYNTDLSRQQQYYHHLRLIWDEHGTDIEYTLRYNTSRPGFWLASEPQRGVMLQINHSHFAGTVQVMKAVGDHMVLTFCEGLPSSKLFSIVLSRKPDTLTYDDIQGVRALLKRRGLLIKSVRKICKNNATNLTLSATMAISAAIISLAWNKNQ